MGEHAVDRTSGTPRHARRGDAGAADALRSILDEPGASASPRLPSLLASRTQRRLVGGAVAAVLVAWLGWWLLAPVPPPVELTLPVADASELPTSDAGEGPGDPDDATSAASTPAASTTTSVGERLVVHVAGAAAQPGVVQVPPGARVADAIAAAGGLRPDADADRVNLAAPLEDGSRVYVPRIGEEVEPQVLGPEPPPGSGGGGGGSSGPGPVDLNRASADELQQLPGIGPATAAAIVAHRDANGPFRSVDQLDDVRGIGPAKLEQLRPLVVVGR